MSKKSAFRELRTKFQDQGFINLKFIDFHANISFYRKMKNLLDVILFPVLPLIGFLFVLFFFRIGFYVYNNPSIDDDKICSPE